MTRLRLCVAACLLLVAVVGSPVVAAVDCSVGTCAAAVVHVGDVGGLGDCDDRGHCASHGEVTAFGLLLVAGGTVALAARRGLRPWPTSAPPRPLFVEGLYRPPRFA